MKPLSSLEQSAKPLRLKSEKTRNLSYWKDSLSSFLHQSSFLEVAYSPWSQNVAFLEETTLEKPAKPMVTTPSSSKPKVIKTKPIPKNIDSFRRAEWDQFFKDHKPNHRLVKTLASRLNRNKQHESLMYFLQSALVNGHSQPWMYEVLAIAMDITGQPKEDIERVLLSLSDFTKRDVESLLLSAAYLVRFKAYRQGLDMYRQASKLSVNQPEPYILGLKLAKREHDSEAILWAASGLLTYDWELGYEKRHQEAKSALLDLIQVTRKSGKAKLADQYQLKMKQSLQRDLIIIVTWTGNADLNLSVEEPQKEVCSRSYRRTSGGGVHVFDGAGPDPKRCFEKYVCAIASQGYYRIRIQHVAGNVVGNRLKIKIIRYQGTPDESEKVIPVTLDRKEKIYKISLHEGRRQARMRLPSRLPMAAASGKTRTALLSEARHKAILFQVVNGGAGGAVGYRPVVTPISEGAFMNASAVISADRRYVRINVQPLFNSITDVFTFGFLSSGGGGIGNGNGGNGGIPNRGPNGFRR